MAEYIEKEMLLHSLSELGYSCCNYWPGIRDVILTEDSADVAPVVHGRWLKTEEPLGWREVDCIECSACHDSWIADEDYGLDFADYWKYCPNCGARMDGE